MKKLSCILLVLLMLSALAMPAAAESGLEFRLTPSKTTIAAGDEVTFSVSVSGTASCTQIGFIPVFSGDVFEIVSVQCTASGDILFKNANQTTGGIAIQYSSAGVPSGEIGKLTLRVKNAAAGSTQVSLNTSAKNGSNTVTTTSAPVTLSSQQPSGETLTFALSAGTAALAEGKEVTFTVSVSGSASVTQIGYIPDFPAESFEVVSAQVTASGDILFKNANQTTGGVAIQYSAACVPSGELGRFTLRVKSVGNNTVGLSTSAKNGANSVATVCEPVQLGAACEHSYAYAVSAAPTQSAAGTLTGTCSKCGDTVTVTLPVLDQVNYTWSVTKAASCTVNGSARYTWKNTEYGTFSFDAAIAKLGHTFENGKCRNCGEPDPNFIPGDPTAPRIIVESKNAYTGKTVTVKLSLENNPGIISMLLRVDYNSSVMKLTGVEDAGILGATVHKPTFTNPYYLSWANDTAEENFTVNGTIVTLTFQVAEDAEPGDYTVKVSYDAADIFNFDGDDVAFQTVDGKITVKDVLIGDVNGDGTVNSKDRMVLSRYLARWDDYPESSIVLAAADVNGDGTVNSKDRMVLSRYLAKWDDYPELPHA